ncbi:MAG: N-acetylmuramoyl-L-alanine amidase [Candidatus Woesearchaeota archaeon]
MRKAQAKVVLPPIFIAALGLGVVFLSILYAVLNISSNEAYLRQLYITKLGLNLQGLQALGKDINAELDIIDAGGYHLIFEDGQVYTSEGSAQTSTFFFTRVPGNVFVAGEYKPEKGQTIGPLKQFKMGRWFGVARPQDTPSPYMLTCDASKGATLRNIALDPGHGYDASKEEGDKGYIIQSLGTTESEYTLKLANSLRAGKVFFNPTRTLRFDSIASIEARQKTSGDAIISLHAGIREDDQDTVKAYYNADTPGSSRLACEILNELTKKFRIPVRPIPVNMQNLPPEDPKQVLKGTRPAVLLEIGNAAKNDSILTKIPELGIAIYNGIKNYGVE